MSQPDTQLGQEALFAPEPPAPEDEFPVVAGATSSEDEPEAKGNEPVAGKDVPDRLDALYAATYRQVHTLLTEIWGERVAPHDVHEATATLFIAKTG